jgi:hypothetical protein
MRFFATVLLVMILAAAGCARPAASSAPPAETASICSNTVRIGVLQDKSASASPNGVYQIEPMDLRNIAEVVITCGGELGLGIVGTSAGGPLLRWAVPAPTPAPAPPQENLTAINGAIARADYQTRRAAWDTREEARVTRARHDLDDFILRATSMLSIRPNHPTTPLWLALARVDAFLGEPNLTMPSHRYIVLSSDGVNTAGEPIALTSNATLFVSNGSQAIGSLSKLPLTVVENPIGAFRKIIEQERSHALN